MHLYTNNFSLAMNEDMQELAISFRQESPVFNNADNNITEVNIETVSDLVMSKKLAIELANCLISACNNNSSSDEEL